MRDVLSMEYVISNPINILLGILLKRLLQCLLQVKLAVLPPMSFWFRALST
jgi:hypothetical protein